jgi:hypothetical protein
MKAMKGFGTDEDTLSAIITRRSNAYLQEVKKVFFQKFGKTAEEWIKSETGGHYEQLLVALLEPHDFYLAQVVMDAIKGLGTNEDLLIDMLCTKSDAELKVIAAAFHKKFGKDMLKEIVDDLDGDFKNLIASLFVFARAEAPVDANLAKKDAQTLFEKGEGKWGTDEATFVQIFTRRNRAQLEAASRAYADRTGHTLEVGIKKETSGYFAKALIALTTPLPEYYANRIEAAIAGAGTDDITLIRIFVSLSQDQLRSVNQYYTHKHGKSLLARIKEEVSGDYGKCLLALIPTVA